MNLRGTRGSDRVRSALGVEAPGDAAAIIAAGLRFSGTALGLPSIPIHVASQASRLQADARGRYAAGLVTLYPRAFADPLTLAFTLLHEMGHAAGLDEAATNAFASRVLLQPHSSETATAESR